MTLFMVETYEARGRAAEHAECLQRARAAADELAREGTRVLYVRSVFVPEDETAFHFFEAPTPEAVVRVSQLARLSSPRVVEAAE